MAAATGLFPEVQRMDPFAVLEAAAAAVSVASRPLVSAQVALRPASLRRCFSEEPERPAKAALHLELDVPNRWNLAPQT